MGSKLGASSSLDKNRLDTLIQSTINLQNNFESIGERNHKIEYGLMKEEIVFS